MDQTFDPNAEKKLRRLSRSFRFYKYAAIVLFLIFTLGGLFVFKDDITAENIRYLIKYLDFNNIDTTSGESSVTFDSVQGSNKASLYKNDLVLSNPNGVDVFDLYSGRIFSDTFVMNRPSLSVSRRSFLVTDLGGKEARLYNSFSCLWKKSFDYPIFCSDASDSGKFVIATSEKNYHSAVYVYDSAYSTVFKWLSADKYVGDVALSDSDDPSVSIAALRADNGDLVCELILFDSGSGEMISSNSLIRRLIVLSILIFLMRS